MSSRARIACSDARLASTLREQHGCEVVLLPARCAEAPLCGWLGDCPADSRGRLQASLLDAIETLEQSRHAFRSRELGQLRQRLENILSELSDTPQKM
ncbi:TPA: hypothetical protein ACQJWO_005693 [Klebsiella pneumoniae]